MESPILLTVNRDLLPSEFKWLRREFKKGETLIFYSGQTMGCIGEGGIPCSIDGKMPFFELPSLLLSILHKNKPYTIFITQNDVFYAKAEDGELLACIADGIYPFVLDILPEQLPTLF